MTGHDEVREALELAAVEPGGLDRLAAGDRPEAAALAGHLAGCPTCLEELARLRRADAILRPILATAPDPALRERTLALVRSAGVPRDVAASPGAIPATAVAAIIPSPDRATAPGSPAAPAPGAAATQRTRRRPAAPAWLGAIAAVLVVGFVGGALLVGAPGRAPTEDAATALHAITVETAALLAAGDAREIVLRDASGVPAGSVVLSATADRLVASASGLPAPTGGDAYRCWVDAGGTRLELGTMWWAEGVAWWAGDVAIPADLPAGAVYGVSRVKAGSEGPGTVLLSGGF